MRVFRVLFSGAILAGGMGAAPPPPFTPGAGVQVTIHQRIIIRIPRVSDPAVPAARLVPRQMHWKEKHADRCVIADQFAGATITDSSSVDLITRDGRRMRAILDDKCPSLDFYAGFYLIPGRDGKICARRDVIRSRSGRSCEIATFKRLVPER
ncbi:hypothetical protein FHR23_002983 [Stakelama sediminis]|uniref:Protease inhibitor Inh n=1 Tax=Stakelama sediminis TaxID=463200 RepID=A0A840Z2A4_9SPHN|nr:hypothetical protein [Stakelama sediminis]